ncbi:MAG: type Z 30S ribosomal protein S14 [Thermotogae bacterium]|nr:type Z 30S ribosomal protein S14 [Thermotogota bacterium]RKX46735.1 MAG: type Z 30S ribosomal protein S14 [Thermotogota bacterium]
MAKKAMVERWKKPKKFKTREYSRCVICGRPRSVYREFGICRVCFRRLASEGKLPGVKKASW